MALSRSEVIEGALDLLDKKGLDALTMRRLAHTLGVQAGAIYWHFKNKQDLYDAMADAIFEGGKEPPVTGPWEEQLTMLSRRMAAALTRRRDSARLFTLVLKPGPNTLGWSEALLEVLRSAGFSPKATLWASAGIGYYVLGYVTDLQATEAAKARGVEAALRSLEKQIDPKRYPRLFEVSRGGWKKMMSTQAFEERFEFGLQVILTGLKAERAAPRRPKKRRG